MSISENRHVIAWERDGWDRLEGQGIHAGVGGNFPGITREQ